MELSLVYFLCILSLASASFPFNFGLSSSPVLLPRAKNPTSKDGNCGSNSETNATCLTSTFGNCCSEKGFCGKTSAYCSEGCQSAFGSCSSSEDGQLVSTSGSCGATSTSNITCEGSTYGDCCSEKGYCGKNATYCGAGSGIALGFSPDEHVVNPDGIAIFRLSTLSEVANIEMSTGAKTSTSTAAASTSLGAISIDGNCGSNSDINATCQDSTFGDCCSAKGYCGKTSDYCASGCQSDFGSCDSTSSSASESASSSTSSSESSSSTPSTTPSTAGLSTGAKAGIAVGCVIGGLGAIGLVGFLVLRSKNRKSSQQLSDSDAGKPHEETRYELHDERTHEVHAQNLVELPADYGRVDDRAAAGYDGAYRGH
ncbi:agglutinin isolectin 1 precursor [Fusarium acutatum]|uniref:Agglutinin isolectin 1 n=1 Tax=Fusarium acutatum TaxID=78861 RepID=A0A8H4JQS3_9HYPO|nr:agglutinin isolectin 1 precursor [Fusarium acutatum]